jgi:3-hydroxyacyl-[acyl-carrier-protein] dehydratase
MTQDLFTISDIQSGENELRAVAVMNPDHRIFEGHFPGAPVTPGVIQLEMVKALLSRHFQTDMRLHTIRTCKFLEVLDPRLNPVIDLIIKLKQSDSLEVTASGHQQEKTFFKVQATYFLPENPESAQHN